MSDVQKHYYDILDQIRTDLSCSKITKDEYHKKLLILSYELALKGFDQDSFYMFLEISSDYFTAQSAADMAEDEMFHRKCIFVYELYKYLNYIDWSVDATQKGATA
jgi:hypothetical protein